MKDIKTFINESVKADSKLRAAIIDCIALGLRWVGGEKLEGDDYVPASEDKLPVNLTVGNLKVKNDVIKKIAGYIIEQWVITQLPNAMKDENNDLWYKAIPADDSYYDLMYYKDGDESNNIKMDVKSYSDGKLKNLKFSSELQKEKVDLYIFVDYSVDGNNINFNSVKLSKDSDSLNEIKTKKSIPAKFVKNADDIKKNDTGNGIIFLQV